MRKNIQEHYCMVFFLFGLPTVAKDSCQRRLGKWWWHVAAWSVSAPPKQLDSTILAVQNGFPCLTGNCCAGKIVSSRTHPYYLSKETVDLSNCLFWTLETKFWRSSMFSGIRLSIECHIVSADRAHCGMWSEVVLKRGNVRSISIVFLQTLESLEYNNYYTV